MEELKTKKNAASVAEFVDNIPDAKRREESKVLLDLMRDATGEAPVMWGDSIVGYGDMHYKGKSGREGDWFCVGFSPRKQAMTVYLSYGFEGQDLLQRLGRYKTGKACLYLPKLEEVDLNVLAELVKWSLEQQRKSSV